MCPRSAWTQGASLPRPRPNHGHGRGLSFPSTCHVLGALWAPHQVPSARGAAPMPQLLPRHCEGPGPRLPPGAPVPRRANSSRQLRPLRAPPPGRSDSGGRATPVPQRTLRHGGAGAGACEPPRLPAPVLGRVALPGCWLQVNSVRCKGKGCWGSGRPQRRTSASPPGRRRLREESRPWPLGPQCPRHAPGQPQLFS